MSGDANPHANLVFGNKKTAKKDTKRWMRYAKRAYKLRWSPAARRAAMLSVIDGALAYVPLECDRIVLMPHGSWLWPNIVQHIEGILAHESAHLTVAELESPAVSKLIDRLKPPI